MTEGYPDGMLPSQRQSVIYEYLLAHGAGRVNDLATQLDVSEMTIRRDIEALAEAGAVEREHGGARLPRDLSHYEPGFERKLAQQTDEKVAIAKVALDYVAPGLAIGLTAGTTTYALAKELTKVNDLTIVTNSLSIAALLYRASSLDPSRVPRVIVTGGERTPSDALVGPVAVSSIRQFHVDVLFLGVHGADKRAGLTTPNLAEAETNRTFIESAQQIIVLADHTKWGTIGMCNIAPLSIVDQFISDDQLPESAMKDLSSAVRELIIARADHPSGAR